MALSYVTYTGDGVNNIFVIPFPYLEGADIVVEVDNVEVSATLLTASTIQTAETPAVGTTVRIRRDTDLENPVVDFSDGSTLTAANLDQMALQNLYAAQEAQDEVERWRDFLETLQIEAGNLPSVDDEDDNSILVVSNGVWTVAQPTQFATNEQGALADSALQADDVGTAAALNTGTATGDVVVLQDVSGSPGLPAVSGTNLTGILHTLKYAKITEKQNHDIRGGTYTSASTWVNRSFNTIETDEIGGIAIVSPGTAAVGVSVPAGRYYYRGRCWMYNVGHTICRVTAGGVTHNSSITNYGAGGTSTGATFPEIEGVFTLAATGTVRLQVIANTANASDTALGGAHLIVGAENRYAVLELWKIE